MKTAVIILNRNLPEVTNALYEHIEHYDADLIDIFVIEAGSDDDNLSKYATWHEKSPEVRQNGLRYGRGMNYALSILWKEGRFQEYDYFFLLTNDTELQKCSTIASLQEVMLSHPKVGILSPCSRHWGEYKLFKEHKTLYFWFIHNTAYFLRREFIESICNKDNPDQIHFLFDGSNFRGYGSESELIAKAYINNWAAAITTIVEASENESYLIDKADLIKTDSFAKNILLYIEEGERWMHYKYGFNNQWMMQEYVKLFYDKFFDFNPECTKYKI